MIMTHTTSPGTARGVAIYAVLRDGAGTIQSIVAPDGSELPPTDETYRAIREG